MRRTKEAGRLTGVGRLSLLSLIVAIPLVGCAQLPRGQDPGLLHQVGLTSGPLPPAKPFVSASRPVGERPLPNVYGMPAPRADVVLTQDQERALEASLASQALTPPYVPPRRKAKVTKRIKPLF